MRKFWMIFSALLTIGTLIFAYVRRYLARLTFDIDILLDISNISSKSFVTPLSVEVDNKNSKSLTVRNLDISIYSENNILIAKTFTPINSYRIEGHKNNKFTHDFKVEMTSELVKIIKDQLEGKFVDVYSISNFDIFGLIPISVREEMKF